MTASSVVHATFTVERLVKAAPGQVFAAFADAKAKTRWFASPEDLASGAYALDFRVGGRERSVGGAPGGTVYTYDGFYQDIVPGRRIVVAYTMDAEAGDADKARISASVATFEFRPEGTGTRVVYTEQAAYLDGLDKPAFREEGMNQILDTLVTAVDGDGKQAG